MSVLIETSLGDITVDLFTEKCPIASKNFLKLCKIKQYNNALFHTIEKDYLTEVKAQTNKSIYEILEGPEKKYFPDEIYPDLKYNKMGLIGTSNLGPNKNQANFFITLTNRPLPQLDGKHTIFGQVVLEDSQETLNEISEQYVDTKDNRPYYNIRIKHTMVLEDPFEDLEGLAEPEESPEEVKVDDNGRLEFWERDALVNYEGMDDQEIEKETKKYRATTQAINLEILGDIADADQKPPDNILFVCKLNQATQESDLELIFSRFGSIKKCEVVRDWKTGQSLQYAFIEFETESACQEAFFKMDNVLIDERRIHVNFCQSVEKLWTKYKKRNQERQKEEAYKKAKGYQNQEDPQEKIVLKDKYTERRGKYNYVFKNDESRRRDDSNRKKYRRKSSSYSSDSKDERKKEEEQKLRSRSNSSEKRQKQKKRRSRSRSSQHKKEKKHDNRNDKKRRSDSKKKEKKEKKSRKYERNSRSRSSSRGKDKKYRR